MTKGLVAVAFILVHAKAVLASSASETIAQPAIEGIWGFGGHGTSIAVIDTGIDIAWPEFGSCSAPGAPGCRVTELIEIAPDDGQFDISGHGTTVAAVAASVAPGADIIGLDVFTNVGSSHGVAPGDLRRALQWVLDNWQERNIVAVNISADGGMFVDNTIDCSTHVGPLADIFAQLEAKGILVVTAAGNDGYELFGEMMCDPRVVVVGNIHGRYRSGITWSVVPTGLCPNFSPTPLMSVCSSNSHNAVRLFAPGVAIPTSGGLAEGTSVSAPQVAAAAAIIWPLVDGTATLPARVAKIRTALLSSRNVVTDWAGRSAPALNFIDAIATASSSTLAAVKPAVQPFYNQHPAYHVDGRQLMDLMSYRRFYTSDATRVRSRALAPLILSITSY